ILYLEEIIDWWREKSDYENNDRIEGVQFGYVWDPAYLNPTILPSALKVSAMKNCKDTYLSNLLSNELEGHDAMASEDDQVLMKKFLTFVHIMDGQRGLNAAETFPELFDVLKLSHKEAHLKPRSGRSFLSRFLNLTS